jgi:class 3 adenylate cyclase
MIDREHSEEYKRLERAIATLETQRITLGETVVEAALGPMRQQLAELEHAKDKSALAFEGERKLVTVMFADFSGFTALAEELDPEAVRELVNTCFDRLVPVIEKYGGTVEKFIGDEIIQCQPQPRYGYAYWGQLWNGDCWWNRVRRTTAVWGYGRHSQPGKTTGRGG